MLRPLELAAFAWSMLGFAGLDLPHVIQGIGSLIKKVRELLLPLALLAMPPSLIAQQLPGDSQPAGNDVIWDHIETLESMVSMWPRQEYYRELATLYGRVADFDRQLQVYEIANAMGWLTETAQFIQFARLLLWAQRTDEVDEFLLKALEKELEDPSNRNIKDR